MVLEKECYSASGAMVATQNQYATEAGLEVLKAGGNAIDAAVAACFAIGVVEPASSGLGGGGYLVYEIDGRGGVIGFQPRAPFAATSSMYRLDANSTMGPPPFCWNSVVDNENIEGPLSIAVPGTVAGLCTAHQRFGRLPLKEVITPALSLARNGFFPTFRTIATFGTYAGMLFRHPELRDIFMPGGNMPTGDLIKPAILRQADLATTLEEISKYGQDAFYKGEIAKAIVEDIKGLNGILSLEDFARYQPFVWDGGLEFGYRGLTIRVPPFASGGVTCAMIFKMMENYDLRRLGHNTFSTLNTYIQSVRLANADRYAYVADPKLEAVPWNGLLSERYLKNRSDSISADHIHEILPGNPWEFETEYNRNPDHQFGATRPDNGTTHINVIDSDGNGVALTNTIMSAFGSGVVPKHTGVVMNNGMMWFDPVPKRVNSVAPGKFPLNNMTPSLILKDRKVKAAVGASGGRRIVNCVTQLVMNMIDFGMLPQQAVDAPRVDSSLPFTISDHRIDPRVISQLKTAGHDMRINGEEIQQTAFAPFACPNALLVTNEIIHSGVDQDREFYASGVEK